MFQRVAEFHRIFDQLISDEPGFPEQRVRGLRRRLLREELNEFCHAYKNDDIVEMADGLADMCYVIAGTCVSYGIAPEGRFESPFQDIFKQRFDLFICTYLDNLLTGLVDQYEAAEDKDDLAEVQSCLLHLMMFIFGVSVHLGIPINTVFAEVHRSNMSKVEADGKPRYREDGKLLKGSMFSPPDIRSVLFPEEKVQVNTLD